MTDGDGVLPRVVLAVDGNSLVHRSFHAAGDSAQPGWAVRGLLTQLVAAVERVQPAAVVVGFDDPDRSLRRERWPQYKAQRGEKLDALVEQLAHAVQRVAELGAAVVVPPGLEADDVLASVAASARARGERTVVVTSDRDAFSLIDDSTHVLRIINGGVDASPVMTADRLVTLLGVRPDQYRDFAALRGDPSDNLPGVRGIGPRHAARLLGEFGTAAAAFAALAADADDVARRLGAGVMRRLAAPGAEDAWRLNCRVMTMHDDVALDPAGGVLPWDAAAVRAAYARCGLVWSVRSAVRVLAGVEDDEVVPVYAEADTSWSGPARWRTGSWNAPRLPRLVPAAPRAQQLSLFE